MMVFRLLISFLLWGVMSVSLQAEVPDYARAESVILCEEEGRGLVMPSFDEAYCRETTYYKFSPFKKLVWIKTTLDVSDELIDYKEPLGLFLSGKIASKVYLNGDLIGTNGSPAMQAEDEIVGKMDVVFYLRTGQVKAGPNEIIIQMSGHHGFIPLAYPIHFIAVGPYQYPPNIALQGYLPSFIPFGILLVGALYFGAIALYRQQDRRLLLLPFAALFAVGQLIAEVSRGLIQYDYPYHDVRLVLVMLFAAATGLCLLVHVVDRYGNKHKGPALIFGLVATIIVVSMEDTFGGKALLALQGPAFIGGLGVGLAARAGKEKALSYAVVLLAFSVAIQPVLDAFLDVYYFYMVAALLLFMFVQQARTNEMEKKALAAERARAERLQQILADTKERQTPSAVKVSEAGKVEMISADKIIYCKSAADYVELHIEGRGSVLRAGSLSELEKDLPQTFLRVHRSYVVNGEFIKALKREANGSGSLQLITGDEVPVSRRIMPTVRKALV
ncbi:MAG: LytTR family DNA-binding domain-containing protein [Kordiimonas sp.]